MILEVPVSSLLVVCCTHLPTVQLVRGAILGPYDEINGKVSYYPEVEGLNQFNVVTALTWLTVKI